MVHSNMLNTLDMNILPQEHEDPFWLQMDTSVSTMLELKIGGHVMADFWQW